MADSEIEDKLGASPGGTETDVLIVVVNDEASQTKDSGVVAADIG